MLKRSAQNFLTQSQEKLRSAEDALSALIQSHSEHGGFSISLQLYLCYLDIDARSFWESVKDKASSQLKLHAQHLKDLSETEAEIKTCETRLSKISFHEQRLIEIIEKYEHRMIQPQVSEHCVQSFYFSSQLALLRHVSTCFVSALHLQPVHDTMFLVLFCFS